MIVKLNHELVPFSRWMMKRASSLNSRHKMRGVLAADGQHAVELLDLLEADGAGELERADVVARHDESIRLEKGVVVPLPLVDDRVGRHVARPAVIPNGASEMIDFRVVRHQQPSLHRRDVMGVEGAEGIDVAERAAEPAVEAGAHRLAVVLEHDEVVRVAERPYAIERRGIAENADGDDHARVRRQRGLELRRIHVERVELDVDEPQLQPILLQRMECRGPRNGGHDDFVSPLQWPIRSVKQRRDADEISGRSRVDHHRVLHAEARCERVLEEAHLLAHREAAAAQHALHRVELFLAPACARKLVSHQERTSVRAASAMRAASG